MKVFWLLLTLPALAYSYSARIIVAPDAYILSLRGAESAVKKHGTLVGADFEAAYEKGLSFAFFAHVAKGSLKGVDPFELTLETKLLERYSEVRLGYRFPSQDKKWQLLPYTGYGFYKFEDKWEENDSLLRLQMWYLPLALQLRYLARPLWTLGLHGGFDFLMRGRWKEEQHPLFSEGFHRLKSRTALFIEASAKRRWQWRRLALLLALVPYVRSSSFERCPVNGIDFTTIRLFAYGARLELGIGF